MQACLIVCIRHRHCQSTVVNNALLFVACCPDKVVQISNNVQVKALCENQRGNVQLLPFYMRIAATLSAVFPDVGAALLKAQEDEFEHLQVRAPSAVCDQACPCAVWDTGRHSRSLLYVVARSRAHTASANTYALAYTRRQMLLHDCCSCACCSSVCANFCLCRRRKILLCAALRAGCAMRDT